MTIQDAIKLIDKPIYTFEIDRGRYYIYKDIVWAVGRDFVFVDDESLGKEGGLHFFRDYDTEWFDNKEDCIAQAEFELEELNNP